MSGIESKLCEQCQTMVHTALRREASRQAPVLAIQESTVAPPIQQGASLLNHPSFEFVEDGATTDSWFEPQLQPSILVEQDDDVEGDASEVADSHYIEQTSYDAHAGGSPVFGEEQLTVDRVDAQPVDHSYDNGQQSEIWTERGPESVIGIANSHDEDHEELTEIEASTDPWGNPLPSWDYSRNEWPVLLGPQRDNAIARHRPLLIGLALLAVAVIVYLLVSRPAAKQTVSATTASSAAESAPANDEARTSAGAGAEDRAQPPVSAVESASAKPDQTTPVDLQSSIGASDANGRYSLQAAAFPTQEGADEFVEKLRRAGVPSYVVAADIARRGRWFRVRVGRFNSAEDAQRFAVEVQMRGKAAGLTLQLIGCQYEQP